MASLAGSAPKRKSHLRRKYDRFDSWVERSAGGCWQWRGAASSSGYGTFWADRRTLLAHRYAYERWVEPIPEGLTIDHLCRNKLCVNPAHLEVVTHRENILRGDGVTAVNARKTHCDRGHEFTPENTLTVPPSEDGLVRRRCRECKRLRRQENRRQASLPKGEAVVEAPAGASSPSGSEEAAGSATLATGRAAALAPRSTYLQLRIEGAA